MKEVKRKAARTEKAIGGKRIWSELSRWTKMQEKVSFPGGRLKRNKEAQKEGVLLSLRYA